MQYEGLTSLGTPVRVGAAVTTDGGRIEAAGGFRQKETGMSDHKRSERHRFKIGDWVRVARAVAFANYDSQRTVSHLHLAPFAGQIIGGSHKQIGKVVGGAYEERAYLAIGKTVFVWLVRRGVTNKPICVLPDDLQPCEPPPDGQPWRWVNPGQWSEHDRKCASENVVGVPRDVRGRFATAQTGEST